jgi:hypothetical protein
MTSSDPVMSLIYYSKRDDVFFSLFLMGGVVQFIQLINNNEGVKTMLEKNETNSVGNA